MLTRLYIEALLVDEELPRATVAAFSDAKEAWIGVKQDRRFLANGRT